MKLPELLRRNKNQKEVDTMAESLTAESVSAIGNIVVIVGIVGVVAAFAIGAILYLSNKAAKTQKQENKLPPEIAEKIMDLLEALDELNQK